ncbi:MAG: carboxypeptidase regulatory-like domain-containing protein [Silvibacterium sp.]|nr:carboxypeptidase regulatory-like domain-containing protein [Silvibacterium sp.]
MRLFLRMHRCRAVSIAALCVLLAAAAYASSISGTVTNKTTNKPSAGDDVVLIAFGQGMQEAARTKADEQGHFTLDIPDNGMHLVRVDHQKAAYFEPVPAGTKTVNVTVYDVAAKVEGVSTEADVMRIETTPQGLHVVQNYFVKNESNPPRTQFSNRAYEIYLPENAKIEASAAMGPAGMPVSSSPVKLDDPGHYAFIFPVRPGETRFQLSYTLPYSGSYKFNPRIALPTGNLAVMLPKTMQFTGGAPFQQADVDATAQTYLARNVQPNQALAFTVSGMGSMPRDSQQTGAEQEAGQQAGAGMPGAGEQPASAGPDNRPGGGLGTPIDTPDPLQKYKWWILSGLALVLVAAAAFFLRVKPTGPPDAPAGAHLPPSSPLTPAVKPLAVGNGHSKALLAALKDELFALETERLEGKLSEADYAETKSALEVVLRRALARQSAP